MALPLVVMFACTRQKPAVATQATNETQVLAFPGAEGFGKFTTGGRGGKVIYVTNLKDNGPGSLRQAVEQPEPRTILFAVSGTIALEAPLVIQHDNITLAGQSAPGEGICISNYPVSINASNIIIRYMRFRMGDEKGQEADAISANSRGNNIIIDHCSMSWATDECASFYRNKNFTLQWSIISESLNASVHSKGDHGYGGIWGGEGATFHHNLLACHTSRNPRFSGSPTTPNSPGELVDFRNNVIFNWGGNSIYGGEKGRYNVVNNYLKPGPATQPNRTDRIINPWQPYGRFFVTGNFIAGQPGISENNWAGGVQADHPDSARAQSPFQVVKIEEQDAQTAYKLVLQHAGASYRRDAVDARVVAAVRSGNATAGKRHNGIIDSQKDVGGWPVLSSAPAPADTDKDGMPDAWEKARKLDPAHPADGTAYKGSSHYTNLEVYLNSLVE